MQSVKRNILSLLCALIFLCFANHASAATKLTMNALRHVEVSIAGGPNWTHASNASIQVSPTETDSLLVKEDTRAILWRLGIGYRFYVKEITDTTFINDVLLELNLYRSSASISGEVWQYELPQNNNYTFRAPVTNTRIMLDVKPSVYTWKDIILYPVVGVGITWNDMSYFETPSVGGVPPSSAKTLARKSNNHFAYDLGVGARYDFKNNLILSLEYLYTNLGNNVSPSLINSTIITPPKFTMQTQAVLLGVGVKL